MATPYYNPVFGIFPVADPDTDNPLISKLLDITTDLWEQSGAQALVNCDNPAKHRGWKIEWSGSAPSKDIKAGIIDINLRYPSISWAPCGCYEVIDWPALSLGLGSGLAVGRKVRRKAVRDISVYIKTKFDSPFITLRNQWRRYRNWGLGDWNKYVKLPPVPAGYKRLYRMNRKGEIPKANDSDGTGTGRWFSDDIEYIINHAKYAGEYTEGGTFITYVDVPIDIAKDCHMGNPDSKWRKILADSGHIMDGGRTANVSDVTKNPARFVGHERTAKNEYFLDSADANGATKISQFSSLPDIKVLNDSWEKMERLFDTYDAEKFLDDLSYRNSFINEWNQVVGDLRGKISDHFDNSDEVFGWLMKGSQWYPTAEYVPELGSSRTLPPRGLSNIFDADSDIMKKVSYALGLFTFIQQIFSVASVVTDKNCSPIGRTNFSAPWGLTQKDKAFIKDLRDGRIAKNEQVWAELNPDTCECSECPGGWNFCDNSSITNLYNGSNTCNPPCCGGQEFKPITLVETCKCACPDGQVFMPCECSSCQEGSGTPLLDVITGASRTTVTGICTTGNPDPSKLDWNPKSCTWECKTHTQSYPPHLWGGSITVPVQPPCKAGKTRKPPDCECSGSYAIEDCNLFDFNIKTVSSLRLI